MFSSPSSNLTFIKSVQILSDRGSPFPQGFWRKLFIVRMAFIKLSTLDLFICFLLEMSFLRSVPVSAYLCELRADTASGIAYTEEMLVDFR